jgi:methylmalonyl-CoA/ethylmalonyl-CoA epimerase
MKFHHVGIACHSIESELQTLKAIFGLFIKEISEVFPTPEDDGQVCLVTLKDESKIELVSGKVVKTLLERGFSYYHSCYEVADIDLLVGEFEKKGMLILARPKPAPLFNGRRVAFIMSNLGVIEFLEE